MAGYDTDFWIDQLPGESQLRSWDQLLLGNIVMPGLWEVEIEATHLVEDATMQTNVSQATASGVSQPTFKIQQRDQGARPSTLLATGRLHAFAAPFNAQAIAIVPPPFAVTSVVGGWTELKNILPLLVPGISALNNTTTGFATVWQIAHPATSLLGIDAVVVRRARILPPKDQQLIVQLDMVQSVAWTYTTIPILPVGGAIAQATAIQQINDAAIV